MHASFPILKHIFLIFWIISSTSCSKVKSNDPKTLVIGIEEEIKNHDIRSSSDQNVWKLALLTTQSLLKITEKGELLPSAALTYKIESPHLLTFKLSKDLYFHDESPLQCDDVVYSFADAKRPGTRLLSHLENVDRYECINSHEFRILLKSANAQIFLNNVVPLIRILPRKFAQNEKAFQAQPMGSGPYKFISSEKGKITLQSFSRFSRKTPFDRIILKPINSAHTHFLALLSGDIDLSWANLSDSLLPQLKSNENLSIFREPNSQLFFIGLNTTNTVLRDIKTRLYLLKATDRLKLFNEKIGNNGNIAEGFFLNEHSNFKKLWNSKFEAPSPLKKSLSLTINIPAQEEIRTWAVALQNEWKKYNINLEIKSYEFARFIDSLKTGDYQSFLYKIDTKGDPDLLYLSFHSSQTPPRLNRYYLKSPSLDRLLEDARSMSDTVNRKKIYETAQVKIAQEAVFIPLWFPSNTVIANIKLNAWNPKVLNLIDFLSGF